VVTLPPGRAKVFTEIDHAAAAMEFGLDMRPRTVIVFGNPKLERPPWSRCHCWRDQRAAYSLQG